MSHLVLHHYQEFKEVLNGYEISQRAKKALEGLHLILMVAPFSTGRNTIIRHLVQTGGYHFIVSDTTRPPQFRDGKMEENGVNYFFRSEEDVLNDLKSGEFLEAAIIHEQQVSGISIRELEKAKQLNKVAVTDIEIVGAENIRRAKPDAKVIFLVPPSFEEWQQRIMSRGHMSEQELHKRMVSADKEFMTALKNDYYHYVVAGNIDHTILVIDKIAQGGSDWREHQRGRDLIKHVREQLRHKLSRVNL